MGELMNWSGVAPLIVAFGGVVATIFGNYIAIRKGGSSAGRTIIVSLSPQDREVLSDLADQLRRGARSVRDIADTVEHLSHKGDNQG